MVTFSRFCRHLFASPRAVKRAFPENVLAAIERAITASEAVHGGELRFAVEGSLDGAALWRDQSPRDRALEAFARLRIWDTAANNGVLIYVLLADHAVEIIADRGFTGGGVEEEDWTHACQAMRASFAKGAYERGALEGIAAVGRLMARRFPAIDRDELPNTPLIL
jgi:uncharacterized membrane protein